MHRFENKKSITFNGVTVHNPKETKATGILFTALGAIGTVMYTFAAITSGMYTVLIVALICAGMFVAGISCLRSLKNERIRWEQTIKAYLEYEDRLEKINFYEECVKNGITDLSTKAAQDKLVLIARKYNINHSIVKPSVDKIVQVYKAGETIVKQYELSQNQKKLNAKIKEERDSIKAAEKYLMYKGRNKMVKMYTDLATYWQNEVRKCEEQANALKSSGEKLYNLSKEKEKDWALVGGAVSGIAGGAAGVSAAIDSQIHNAGVQARNSNLLGSIAAFEAEGLIQIYRRKTDAEESAKAHQARADKAETKLTEEKDANELLQKLCLEASDFEVLDTGSVRFQVTFKGVADVIIYDNIKAVIDGHIRADLKSGDVHVGTAKFSLPCDGSRYQGEVTCICQNVQANSDFTVSFEPIKLWVIEADE